MGKAESHPRILLLTGVPGVGKTTLIRNVARDLPVGSLRGFYTQEMREHGRRTGFRLITFHGEEGVMAHIDFPHSAQVGKYPVDVAAASQPMFHRPCPRRPGCGAAPLPPQHENHESDADDAGKHAGYDKKADAARHENRDCQVKQPSDQGKKNPPDYIGAKVGEERLANGAFYAAPNHNPHKHQDQRNKQLAAKWMPPSIAPAGPGAASASQKTAVDPDAIAKGRPDWLLRRSGLADLWCRKGCSCLRLDILEVMYHPLFGIARNFRHFRQRGGSRATTLRLPQPISAALLPGREGEGEISARSLLPSVAQEWLEWVTR